MRTRRYPHLPGVVAWKEHTDGPWYVGPDAGKMATAWAYMIRRQRNRGWHSAYWKVDMFIGSNGEQPGPTFETYGNMDRAMSEIKNRMEGRIK